MAADVPDIALATLASFVSSNISALTVRQEWPYGNEKINYPSLTISTIKPKRTPIMPYLVSKTDPDINNNITVIEAVAFWDFSLQLDLWCRNKDERKQYTEALITLFNSQEQTLGVDGLSLAMTDHFGEICRYEIDTVECVDDESAAQRQERREKIVVLINCRELRSRVYYAMKHIQGYIGVAEKEPTDDTSDTELVDLS